MVVTNTLSEFDAMQKSTQHVHWNPSLKNPPNVEVWNGLDTTANHTKKSNSRRPQILSESKASFYLFYCLTCLTALTPKTRRAQTSISFYCESGLTGSSIQTSELFTGILKRETEKIVNDSKRVAGWLGWSDIISRNFAFYLNKKKKKKKRKIEREMMLTAVMMMIVMIMLMMRRRRRRRRRETKRGRGRRVVN